MKSLPELLVAVIPAIIMSALVTFCIEQDSWHADAVEHKVAHWELNKFGQPLFIWNTNSLSK